MRLRLALVALVMAFPCHAQSTDPYAAQLEDSDKEALASVKAQALESVSHLYYALSCHVFSREGEMASLKQHYFMLGQRAMVEYRRLDLHWPEKVAKAASEGLEKGHSSGCDYWKQNIEEVSGLRREALDAIRSDLPYQLR